VDRVAGAVGAAGFDVDAIVGGAMPTSSGRGRFAAAWVSIA